MNINRKYEKLMCFLILASTIFFLVLLNYSLLNTTFDYYFTIMGLLCCVLLFFGITMRSPIISAIAHYIFSFLIITMVFSNNKYILGLGVVLVLIAIITRKISGTCILKTYQKNVIKFPKFMTKSWNYIFPALLIYFLYKLVN
jgi:hypothetical protein